MKPDIPDFREWSTEDLRVELFNSYMGGKDDHPKSFVKMEDGNFDSEEEFEAYAERWHEAILNAYSRVAPLWIELREGDDVEKVMKPYAPFEELDSYWWVDANDTTKRVSPEFISGVRTPWARDAALSWRLALEDTPAIALHCHLGRGEMRDLEFGTYTPPEED